MFYKTDELYNHHTCSMNVFAAAATVSSIFQVILTCGKLHALLLTHSILIQSWTLGPFSKNLLAGEPEWVSIAYKPNLCYFFCNARQICNVVCHI